MISDWTIYAIHTGFGEWLCPDCAIKKLDDLLGESRKLDLHDARQLWLAGTPIRLLEYEESTFEPMIGVEIDQFVDQDEVVCSECSTVVYNERESRTYRLEITIDEGDEPLPDAEDLCSQVLEGLAPLYGEDNLIVAQVEPEVLSGLDPVSAEAIANLRNALRRLLDYAEGVADERDERPACIKLARQALGEDEDDPDDEPRPSYREYRCPCGHVMTLALVEGAYCNTCPDCGMGHSIPA